MPRGCRGRGRGHTMPGEIRTKHKITLLGADGVGKTCLLLRFAEDGFAVNHMPTIGVDYKSKTVRVGEQVVRLQIWDSAGQERFQSIAPNYFRGSQGIVVVYDVTDRSSFDRARWWLGELRSKFKGASELMDLVLVGNKIDLQEQRDVSEEEGRGLADEFATEYCDVSAKANMNVGPLFNDLAARIVERVAVTASAGEELETEAAMRPYGVADRGVHNVSAPLGKSRSGGGGGFLACCLGRPAQT